MDAGSGYIRFDGGLVHNQHIYLSRWKLEWHFVVPAKPPDWGQLEHWIYNLYRLGTPFGAVYYEYRLVSNYTEKNPCSV